MVLARLFIVRIYLLFFGQSKLCFKPLLFTQIYKCSLYQEKDCVGC